MAFKSFDPADDLQEFRNITSRRPTKTEKSKMATSTRCPWNKDDDSILIDDILSQDETKDIMQMLLVADEIEDEGGLHSFCTSSQMGGIKPRRPPALSLSPLPLLSGFTTSNRFSLLLDDNCEFGDRNKCQGDSFIDSGRNKRDNIKTCSTTEGGISDSEKGRFDGSTGTEVKGVSDGDERGDDAVMRCDTNGSATNIGDSMESDMKMVGMVTSAVGAETDDGAATTDTTTAGTNGDRTIVPEDRQDNGAVGLMKEDQAHDIKPEDALAKLCELNTTVNKLERKSDSLTSTVEELIRSLQFSQHEIDTLKKDNKELRRQLGDMDLEDQRTQYQVKKVEEKIDRMDTQNKKRNLVLEGVPEKNVAKEDVEKTISEVFDQLSVNTELNFEACYRLGPRSQTRPRAILVSFERQTDRDSIYSKRADLKYTADFKRVWVNEDVSPASRRKNNLIKLITREAREQGIDCRSGKYAIRIDNKKFDDSNFEDLPKLLQPSHVKQIQLDPNTLAYQSENAPFSNMFPAPISAGKLNFTCLEQIFQFLHARVMNKPLAATRIFLSRDPYEMKQIGEALGTSEEWERRKFDIMYMCLKRKFEQNLELKKLLLSTGNMELVEATPNRLWGCGATLSSNVIRRHEWPGENKHGQILMTVREELRRLAN